MGFSTISIRKIIIQGLILNATQQKLQENVFIQSTVAKYPISGLFNREEIHLDITFRLTPKSAVSKRDIFNWRRTFDQPMKKWVMS